MNKDCSKIKIFIENEPVGEVLITLNKKHTDEIGSATEISQKIKECLSSIIRENSIKNSLQ